MTALVVHPAAAPLAGIVPGPPDAVVAELALLLGAIAKTPGTSALVGRGLPALAMEGALAALGVEPRREGDRLLVDAVGLDGLSAPSAAVPCGRSGVCLAAIAAIGSAQRFALSLEGDEPTVRRRMRGVARALRRRGAQIEGRLDGARAGELGPPIAVAPAGGGARLSELTLEEADFSAKVAALASGLAADGPTVLSEASVSDDRFERLLRALGLPLESAGPHLRLLGPVEPPAFELELPAESGLSAVLLVAGLLVPRSRVGVRAVAASGARRGWIDALLQAGFELSLTPRRELAGQPTFDITVYGKRAARALLVAGELGWRAGASLPTLAALAAAGVPPGCESEIRDIGQDGLIERTAAMLARFGVDSRRLEGGLAVRARTTPLRACTVATGGQPDLALAATALALAAGGPCRIEEAQRIVESFPRFVGSLRALGARIDVEPER